MGAQRNRAAAARMRGRSQLRKVLCGSTALVGAFMLASAATAQTAGPKAPFTAILDGEVNGNIGILSGTQNSGTNGGHQRDFGMEQNAWMRFFFRPRPTTA